MPKAPPNAHSPKPPAPPGLWWALVVVAAVAAAYWNSHDAPFLFDDVPAVVDNPTIRDLGSWVVLNPPADGSTTTGRPVVNLSYALNRAIGGDSPSSFRVVNVAIHALAALTLMGIVRRTLELPALRAGFRDTAAVVAALFALLWALHPLQTESVVSIAQRTESLCGLFYLLTLYAFVRGATLEAGATDRSRRAWFTLSVAACMAGMGTKEVMVTAPVAVLLFDRTFLAGSFAAAWRQRRGVHLTLAGTWLLLGWLVMGASGARGVAAGFGLGVSPWHYLLTQCEALVLYLRLSVWPHPLVLDYGTGVARSMAEVWWQGPLVLVLLGATVWALVRRPLAGFAGAWFFLILAPSSSVVPLVTQTMAEHRMYLPLAGVVALVFVPAYRWIGPRLAWPLGAVVLVLGVATAFRNHDYRDAFTIWSDTVAKYPSSARAHNNLALVFHEQGRIEEADAHFARAIALQPDYATGRYNWGVTLLERGLAAEAATQFEAALELVPYHADAHVNIGNALMQLGRAAAAVPHYEKALEILPAADAHYNLAVALIELGRDREAARHLRTTLEFDPAQPEAHFRLGGLEEQAGRRAQAEAHYLEALRLAPGHTGAHRKLGLLLARDGRMDQAAGHFRAVIRLDPDDADAHANLGNVHLLQGQMREAVRCYEEALRLRPDDARVRESLEMARGARP